MLPAMPRGQFMTCLNFPICRGNGVIRKVDEGREE